MAILSASAPRLREHLIGGDGEVDQAELAGLGAAHQVAGQQQPRRGRGGDQARQAGEAAGRRDDPEPRLRHAELGALGGDAQRAGERQLEAAADRVAVDRGDRRDRDAGDRVDRGAQAAVVGEVLLSVAGGDLLEVGAGGEDFAAAGDDRAAHVGLGANALGRGAQRVGHRLVEDVSALGVGERDRRHWACIESSTRALCWELAGLIRHPGKRRRDRGLDNLRGANLSLMCG